MKALLDTSPKKMEQLRERFDFIGGQLMTPLTNYKDAGGPYGIDNGAFSGFDGAAFRRLLERQEQSKHRCLFVALPDVVGSARRTLEAYAMLAGGFAGWPRALVAQDGIENLDIPWSEVEAIFIGGSTDWKLSKSAADVLRTAQILGRHTHVGRINTPDRFRYFADLGADTCDGSGISKFSDDMLPKIARALQRGEHRPLLDGLDMGEATSGVAEGV